MVRETHSDPTRRHPVRTWTVTAAAVLAGIGIAYQGWALLLLAMAVAHVLATLALYLFPRVLRTHGATGYRDPTALALWHRAVFVAAVSAFWTQLVLGQELLSLVAVTLSLVAIVFIPDPEPGSEPDRDKTSSHHSPNLDDPTRRT